MIRRWNEATDIFWESVLKNLRAENKIVLIGSTVAFSNDPLDANRFRNVVIIRGAMNGLVEQHVPVPIAMWKPDGVPLNLTGPVTAPIDGKKAAILICYEQLLPWTYINAAANHADVLVGAANGYWVRGTQIAQIQRNTLRSWAHLFKTPFLTAVNQ